MEGGRGQGQGELEVAWARLGAGWPPLIVVASGERAFVHQPVAAMDDPFLEPMGDGPGALASTRLLLDGAIAAARGVTPPGPPPPPLSASQWIWRLAGYVRTTEPTPRLLRGAAARFAAQGRAALARWAALRADEEEGHDRLALRDLEALGLDAARVVEALRPPTACALADRFTRWCAEEDPVGPLGCVGYSYALERLALGRDQRAVDAVQALLPAGVDATRCLRVHSAVGSDARHVDETVALVAALAGAERARVAADCFATASIYYGASADSALPDAAIDERVAPFRRRPPAADPAAPPLATTPIPGPADRLATR